MLEDLLESMDLPIGSSRTGQTIARLVFGAIGTFLALAGLWIGATRGFGESGFAFRIAGIVVFAALGCFCLLTVALQRCGRWPGFALVGSFVGLFVVRLVFGG